MLEHLRTSMNRWALNTVKQNEWKEREKKEQHRKKRIPNELLWHAPIFRHFFLPPFFWYRDANVKIYAKTCYENIEKCATAQPMFQLLFYISNDSATDKKFLREKAKGFGCSKRWYCWLNNIAHEYVSYINDSKMSEFPKRDFVSVWLSNFLIFLG